MGKQKSEIDRDEVRKILKVLKANLEEFEQGSGTRNDISIYGNITTAELGDYGAVRGLAASTRQAHSMIKGQYDQFIQSYEGVINALERMVGKHDEKEQENAAAANRVITTTGAGPTPTTRNTKAF